MSILKSDILKGHINASDLASYFWCAEQCHWRVRGITRKVKASDIFGKAMHSELVRKPEKDYEIEFFNKLRKFRPIYRACSGVKIFCCFDAVDLSGIPQKNCVRLIEFKTTSKAKVPSYYLPQAIFQLEIYYWAYKPIVEKWAIFFQKSISLNSIVALMVL